MAAKPKSDYCLKLSIGSLYHIDETTQQNQNCYFLYNENNEQ